MSYDCFSNKVALGEKNTNALNGPGGIHRRYAQGLFGF
jgi:hypothetical protein